MEILTWSSNSLQHVANQVIVWTKNRKITKHSVYHQIRKQKVKGIVGLKNLIAY